MRVGLLKEQNPGSYSRTLESRLTDRSGQFGFEIVPLEVSWPSKPDLVRPENPEGNLQLCAQLDAVVLLSGVFSSSVGVLSRFAQYWVPKPLVSIGYSLSGVSSVTLDNRGAQKLATEHLIAHHDRRRILYVRGRRGNREAEERYLGYRRALHEHGILFESSLVIDGDFTEPGALRGLSELSETVEFDGVVAANDDMALAVMERLRKNALDVPGEVSVVGFDDVDYAKAAPIPLSSVAQPFDGLAQQALRSLSQQFSGSSVAFAVSVEANLAARASCGC